MINFKEETPLWVNSFSRDKSHRKLTYLDYKISDKDGDVISLINLHVFKSRVNDLKELIQLQKRKQHQK